jgi:hypothetical protein
MMKAGFEKKTVFWCITAMDPPKFGHTTAHVLEQLLLPWEGVPKRNPVTDRM